MPLTRSPRVTEHFEQSQIAMSCNKLSQENALLTAVTEPLVIGCEMGLHCSWALEHDIFFILGLLHKSLKMF